MPETNQADLEALTREIARLEARLASSESQVDLSEKQRQTMSEQARALEQELAHVRAVLFDAQHQLHTVTRTRSWRYTAPVRAVNRAIQNVRRHVPASGKQSSSAPSDVHSARLSYLRGRANELIRTRSRPDVEGVPVDVVIPVYGGFSETRTCLESALASKQRTQFELVVIDDASPEPKIREYLDRLAAQGKITLLRNEANLGFVASCNLGLALHPSRDVVLLNSDTEVANDWLDRLRGCAYSAQRVATVTPFTNNGEICSYPLIGVDNQLPTGTSVEQLDNLFREVNRSASVDLPTCVGFAMYVTRSCLDDIGFFDELLFGRGYGEENDFSLRASARGWRNLLACDVYVRHVGSASFGKSKADQRGQALVKILSLYPHYPPLIQQFYVEDPVRPYRLDVDIARLNASSKPIVLLVTHNWGGGTARHVSDLTRAMNDQVEFVRLAPQLEKREILDLVRQPSGEALNATVEAGDAEGLLMLLRRIRIDRVHYQHLLLLPESVQELGKRLGIPYDFSVHDFYTFCPRITLGHVDSRYCGEPDEHGCDRCLKRSPRVKGVSIRQWRSDMSRLVEGAERVFAPTQFTAERIAKHFPEAALVLASHRELEGVGTEPPVADLPKLGPDEPMRILVVGALGAIKGADVLEAAAIDARARGLPLEFHLLGFAYRQLSDFPKSDLHVHGRFEESEALSCIRRIDPHLAWFPSLTPETYSYTLSAVLDAGLPVAASNLGAVPERIAGRRLSWVMDWRTEPTAWNDFFMALRSGDTPAQDADATGMTALSANGFRYATDYVVRAGRSSSRADSSLRA